MTFVTSPRAAVWHDEVEREVQAMLITRETTVEEALAAHPRAAEVFEAHGCCVADECPDDVLGQAIEDAEYLCHLDDLDALVLDLNALVGGDQAAASAPGPAADGASAS